MRFSEYMQGWLYGPEGYYRRFRPIGKEGDFYTAVSTSPFFGAAIAQELYRSVLEGRIPRDAWLVEIGAHQGYLLADMIQWLYTCDPSLIESMRFATVERQEDVRRAQREYFASRFGSDVKLIQFDSLESMNLEYAFFVSNEILDAFACELYYEGKRAEIEGGTLEWVEAEESLREFARHHRLVKGEIAVGYEAFARRVAEAARSCDFVTFDYGERYVRNDFSIRVYRAHETFPLFDEAVDLSEFYGVSDLTYDVNFGHAIDAFESAGFVLEAYETQARALVRFGIIDLLQRYAARATRDRYLRQADRIKTLLAPTIMGDRFKLLHCSKKRG